MDGRIGQLHIRYRVVGSRGQSLATPPSVGRAALAAAVSRAFDDVLETDEAVIVIRSARVQLALNASSPRLDWRIVVGVAAQLADQITRTLQAPGGGDEIARFDNQPHFAASFLSAFVRGWAWDRWFFGAFHSYRRLGVSATIVAVLDANRDDLPRILTYLRRADSLEAVLASLGVQDRRALQGRIPHNEIASASFRPLAEAAFQIAEVLGWWRRNPARERELFDQFVAARPLEPNWQEPASLAAAVLAVVRYLIRSEDGPNKAGPDAAERLHYLLRGELAWLDGFWMKTEIGKIGKSSSGLALDSAGSARHATPHQRDLLRLIRELIDGGACFLDSHAPDAAANVLRILAALGDHHPTRIIDASGVALIEHVLSAWAALPTNAALREPSRDHTRALALVRDLGPAGRELLDSLAKRSPAKGSVTTLGDETGAGGIFLLARPVLDLGLPALARAADVPLPPLLAGIAAGIFGLRTMLGQRIDPGVALWAALDPKLTRAEVTAGIAAISPEGLNRLQMTLLQRLVGQRHLDADSAAITRMSIGNHHWTVAADPRGLCWPLALYDDDASIGAARVLQVWTEATSEEPRVAKSERDVAADLATVLGAPIVPDSLAVPLSAITSSVVRAWARWIPGVGDSSLPFLLRNCIHRSGRLQLTKDAVDVQLDPAPLDVVLEMAGYFKPLPELEWLGGRALHLAVHRQPLQR